jgi:hypothetical protein
MSYGAANVASPCRYSLRALDHRGCIAQSDPWSKKKRLQKWVVEVHTNVIVKRPYFFIVNFQKADVDLVGASFLSDRFKKSTDSSWNHSIVFRSCLGLRRTHSVRLAASSLAIGQDCCVVPSNTMTTGYVSAMKIKPKKCCAAKGA